jgi:hypothetical protein
MQKSEYRLARAISQSAIKAFRKTSLQKFKDTYVDMTNVEEETTDSLTFGSLVDTLAFEPQLFDERFYIPDRTIDIPGDKVRLIVEKVYKQAKEQIDHKVLLNEQGNLPEPIYIPNIRDINEFVNLTLAAAKEIKFGGTSWSRNTILDKIYEDGAEYFRHMADANGRSVITTIESAEAHQMVENLKNNSRTKMYFVQQEGEILLHQQEIYDDFEYDGKNIPLKCAVDIIRIVISERMVYLPDLKTIYDTREFKEHAKKYGYLEQMSFYRNMVRKFLQRYKGGAFKDFEIATPFDIAIDSNAKKPFIFKFDEDDLYVIEYGNKHIQGWRQTLEDIGWHIKNNVWDESRELYETGEIKLKFFND